MFATFTRAVGDASVPVGADGTIADAAADAIDGGGRGEDLDTPASRFAGAEPAGVAPVTRVAACAEGSPFVASVPARSAGEMGSPRRTPPLAQPPAPTVAPARTRELAAPSLAMARNNPK